MSDAPRDPRPRPKYGEYATPQEQAEIVAKSMPAVSPALVRHGESVPVPSGLVEPDPPADAAGDPPTVSAVPSAASAPPSVTARPTRRRWDLILSIALLAYGLVTVLVGFAQYSDIPALMNQVYATQSIGTFTPSGLAANAGTFIIVINVVLYSLAAWLTVRRLTSGRIAFWIPLSAGIVAGLVTVITVGIVIASDPAFLAYLEGLTGAS